MLYNAVTNIKLLRHFVGEFASAIHGELCCLPPDSTITDQHCLSACGRHSGRVTVLHAPYRACRRTRNLCNRCAVVTHNHHGKELESNTVTQWVCGKEMFPHITLNMNMYTLNNISKKTSYEFVRQIATKNLICALENCGLIYFNRRSILFVQRY